jgi:glycosyltransferase involved in cell wall biosynthesis
VHIHNAPQFVDVLSKGLPQAKLVLHMHNEKQDIFHCKVDVLVGCSHYIRDWYRSRKAPAQRFHVIDNGVDLTAFGFSADQSAVSRLRRRFAIPDNRFILLYVGRISPEKGPDLIVRAMQQLDPSRFHLVMSGEWPQGSPERSERVRYARSLKEMLRTVPHTITGGVPPEEVPDIYRLGDLLLITSRFQEPFSMVAIEAMASGLPVMALRKGGMVEYMVHNENALLIDPDANAETLACAIRKASSSADDLARISRHARQMVETRFGWDEVASQTESLYAEMLTGRAN